ncbi:MAG TPA: hypothetical protein PKA13_03140 [Geminicoccaceae bacterium]|nr:hypothetical protein [Geminicoccus sp.]HMU48742.1 hypothetical protein [Geminicoccaceae bacterium]
MEHAADGPALLVALESSGLGRTLRGSLWLYPAVETLHILGFAVLVGSIVAFDLRLLTAPDRFDVEGWVRRLVPIAAAGLLLAVPMGFLLFTAEATAYFRNPVYLTKMALLLLALANVVWFHLGPYRRHKAIGPSMGIPSSMRLSAGASMVGWIAVLTCGRLIAYI